MHGQKRVGRSVRYEIWNVSESQWLERSTLSSLKNKGFGRLLDHVKERSKSCISCKSRSVIMSLNSYME
jgi:hypothetical protein